jgi:hypothetical protein
LIVFVATFIAVLQGLSEAPIAPRKAARHRVAPSMNGSASPLVRNIEDAPAARARTDTGTMTAPAQEVLSRP